MRKLLFILLVLLHSSSAVANDYFNASGVPATSSPGSSAAMRGEYAGIEDGFDLLPGLAGNNNLPVFVNSGATALEAISAASALIKLGAEATANKNVSGGYVGMTGYSIDFLNAAGTFTSYLENANTASRTYTFPDRDGTVADDTDLALKANLSGPTFTDAPEAPTAPAGTNTTQIATTAFVLANGSASNPNLLINSDFEINQENYAADGVSALAGDDYGHDMWTVYGDANASLIYTKESNGDITINEIENIGGSNQSVGLAQENDDLANASGETLTVSLEVVSLTDQIFIFGSGLPATAISTVGTHSITFTCNGNGQIRLYRVLTPSQVYSPDFRFRNFKVERGSTATAWQKPEPRQEEERAYWYHLKSATIPIPYADISATPITNPTASVGSMILPSRMKSGTPNAFIISGTVHDGTTSVTIISTTYIGDSIGSIRFSVGHATLLADVRVISVSSYEIDHRYQL